METVILVRQPWEGCSGFVRGHGSIGTAWDLTSSVSIVKVLIPFVLRLLVPAPPFWAKPRIDFEAEEVERARPCKCCR